MRGRGEEVSLKRKRIGTRVCVYMYVVVHYTCTYGGNGIDSQIRALLADRCVCSVCANIVVLDDL